MLNTNITFVKLQNGVTMNSAVSSMLNRTDKIDLIRKTSQGYCGSQTCYDYGMKGTTYIKYTSSLAAFFDFTVERTKPFVTYQDSNDSTRFYVGNEILYINWNRKAFQVFPHRFIDTLQQKVHLQKYLGVQWHDSVFEIAYPLADTSLLLPQGIFYSLKEGLLGFYLTNNAELWYKKP